MKITRFAHSIPLLLVVTEYSPAAGQDVPYGVAAEPWDEQLGNHRALIGIAQDSDAVSVHLPWRRHDANPASKAVIIRSAASGKTIDNVVVVEIGEEAGDLVFQPGDGPGMYCAYYMPLAPRSDRFSTARKAGYLAPRDAADPATVYASLPDRHLDPAGSGSETRCLRLSVGGARAAAVDPYQSLRKHSRWNAPASADRNGASDLRLGGRSGIHAPFPSGFGFIDWFHSSSGHWLLSFWCDCAFGKGL